jgi:hypothetical protein
MRVNPTLVKQYARQVAPLGLVLWRQVVAAGSAASSSNGSGGGRLSLAPAQIRQQLAVFAAQSDASKQFVGLPDNRNMPNHLGVLCQLLTSHDDPLTISGSELTDRCAMSCGAQAPCCIMLLASNTTWGLLEARASGL